MRTEDLHDRFSRIVPERTRGFRVLIAGAGMVGSWTALALARMVKSVEIWDFNDVSEFNVGVQAYTQADVHNYKAVALSRQAYGLPLTSHVERFPREIPSTDFVISCVDSIDGRREIAEDCYQQGVSYFIDTRVLGEIACVYPVENTDDNAFRNYVDSLPVGDDLVSAPCGAKGTAFAGMWVASQVCAIVNNIGRGLPLPPKIVWHVGLNQSAAPS